MLEDSSPGGNTHNLAGYDILLLTKVEDLTSYHTRRTTPAEYCHDQHQVVDSHRALDLPGVDNYRCYKKDRKRGDTVENINYSHDELIYLATEVAGHATHDNTYKCFKNNDYEAKRKRNSAAVHKTDEYIHSLLIRTENVVGRKRSVGVDAYLLRNELDNGVFISLGILCLYIKLFDRCLLRGSMVGLGLRPLISERMHHRRAYKGKGEESDEHYNSDK